LPMGIHSVPQYTCTGSAWHDRVLLLPSCLFQGSVSGNTDLNHHGRNINSMVRIERSILTVCMCNCLCRPPSWALILLCGSLYWIAIVSLHGCLKLWARGAVATGQIARCCTKFRSSKDPAVGPLSRARPICPTGRWV
jgi:hypothetical protein